MQLLDWRARSKTVQSNRIDYESDDAEGKDSHWTTRSNGNASSKVSEGENAGVRSKSASIKAESGEEMESKLSIKDD
ncbi:uncharacterized protein TrAtP1_011306 [Trichoderma atroviride]|uniref:uncharacterized protein n=1 Tax=Hypocrea atroviridis TaxID=63577 RepID=UPI003321885B|nr:hypothetical protein TrAtP1_011306 [Trichoderma atroviride]